MKYIGLQQQQARNNLKSTVLLILFPTLVIVLVFAFCLLSNYFLIGQNGYDEYGNYYGYTSNQSIWDSSLEMFINISPLVFGGVLIWFLIAYFANTTIIQMATRSHSLDRKDNKRIYNLVENLCMSQGMAMPKINVIEDNSLNAFASGINKKSYTVTLTRGIINKLDDKELEGVIAHELSHIRNRDVRLLIISIVFVGIFSMLAQMAMRMMWFSGGSKSNSKNDKGNGIIIIIVMILAIVGYIFAIFMRFAISRQREYLADASAATMTKNPLALASALRKISNDPVIKSIQREDVAQLFISHPLKKENKGFSGFNSLFATHPPIKKRIQFLEQA